MNPYEIHIAYVSWGDAGKRRPVLVLSFDHTEVAALKITSQYDNKKSAVQAQYVAIDDWARSGLEKLSFIDIGTIIDLPIAAVHSTPIGKLSGRDLRKLLTALSE